MSADGIISATCEYIEFGDKSKRGVQYYQSGNRVYAVLNNCKHDVIRRIVKLCGSDTIIDINQKKFMLNNTYRAYATCSSEDTFDYELGKKIAKAKLMKRYNRDLAKAIAELDNEVMELSGLLGSMWDMLAKRKITQGARMDELKALGVVKED